LVHGLFSSLQRACPINPNFPAGDLIEIKLDEFAAGTQPVSRRFAVLDEYQNEGLSPSYS
jgi:hypothetical protein